MNRRLMTAIAMVALVLCAFATIEAGTWRAVVDEGGCAWARLQIVNLSGADTRWGFSNCRTAVASTSTAAQTDAQAEWDGWVPAGSSAYVWIYGRISGPVTLFTVGGTAVGFEDSAELYAGGDGEWVVTVDAQGQATASFADASYGLPERTGTLPDMSVEE